MLLLPLATTLGTFAGTALMSLFLAYSVSECMAVGAGFAYYSLSSIFISQYKGPELGTIALISNIARELITLLLTPPACAISWAAGADLLRRRIYYGYNAAWYYPVLRQGLAFCFHRTRHGTGFQRAILGDFFLYPLE